MCVCVKIGAGRFGPPCKATSRSVYITVPPTAALGVMQRSPRCRFHLSGLVIANLRGVEGGLPWVQVLVSRYHRRR